MDFTSSGTVSSGLPDQVPLVRVQTEEKLYDKEAILGRDVTSVFPNETAPDDLTGSFKEALGAVKFVTEKELEDIKAERGARPEDGAVDVKKSLAEILADNKQAKEDAFQEVWKSMKTGKNRPLDEDEVEFLDELQEQETAKEQSKQAEEEDALLSFQVAQAEMANTVRAVAEAPKLPPALLNPAAAAPVKRKPPPLAGIVKVKAKKTRVEEPKSVEAPPPEPSDDKDAGLGMLAGYGSSDDEDE